MACEKDCSINKLSFGETPLKQVNKWKSFSSNNPKGRGPWDCLIEGEQYLEVYMTHMTF